MPSGLASALLDFVICRNVMQKKQDYYRIHPGTEYIDLFSYGWMLKKHFGSKPGKVIQWSCMQDKFTVRTLVLGLRLSSHKIHYSSHSTTCIRPFFPSLFTCMFYTLEWLKLKLLNPVDHSAWTWSIFRAISRKRIYSDILARCKRIQEAKSELERVTGNRQTHLMAVHFTPGLLVSCAGFCGEKFNPDVCSARARTHTRQPADRSLRMGL